MADLPFRTLSGATTALDGAHFERFRSRFQGPVLRQEEPGYDEARALWNGMIDRRPSLIVRCTDEEDARTAVRFAGEHGLLTSVRGGGHNIAGNAACDGGLMIDLSVMNDVNVIPEAREAVAGPGATLGDLDEATQAYGLATPTGINSTTGLAGLTLGGGFGWLSRRHGLTVDNLLSADLVTADGQLVTASAEENSDLFWGIRGGGGNFGVATSFRYRLHAVGPEVYAGLVVHRLEHAPGLLRQYRELAPALSDDAACWCVMRHAPPLPFLPEEVHGAPVLVFALFHLGDRERAERELRPILSLGTPVGTHVGMQPYTDWQKAFDPLLEPGARNYWKSHNFTTLEDGLLDTLVSYAGRLPTPLSEIFVGQVGGEINRHPVSSTAYPHRDAEYVMNVHTRWEDPADDDRCVEWAREFYGETAPYATGGVYVNFMPSGDEDRVRSAYGENFERLASLKSRYDPGNLFRLNQNIAPEVVA